MQDATANLRSLYVDGVLAGTTVSQDGSGSGELWVGSAKGVGEFINGTVDDVRVYGRALSSAEIQALVALTNPAAPTRLFAAASAAGGVNLTWTDNATNESGYKVERAADGVTFNRLLSCPPTPRASSTRNCPPS